MSKQQKETKPHTLVRGNFNVRNEETGRTERQAHGSVHELSVNQARAFCDSFQPVGDGFEGVVYTAPVTPAPRPQPTQPQPAEVEVEVDVDVDVDVEVDVEPDEVDEVVANDKSAKQMIKEIMTSETSDDVDALAESEEARDKPRQSVLDAADKRLDQLEE